MKKPNFEEIIKELEGISQNLRDNSRIGESGIVNAFTRMVSVMGWSSSQMDTSNTQVGNLTDEIKILHQNLKNYSEEARQEGVWMKRMTKVMVGLAIIQVTLAVIQWKVAESQISWSHEQLASQNAALEYQKIHDEYLEKRDIQWRKEDFQFQGRLPE